MSKPELKNDWNFLRRKAVQKNNKVNKQENFSVKENELIARIRKKTGKTIREIMDEINKKTS